MYTAEQKQSIQLTENLDTVACVFNWKPEDTIIVHVEFEKREASQEVWRRIDEARSLIPKQGQV